MQRENIESFDGLSINKGGDTAFVLFHGFGASDTDLAPLSQQAGFPQDLSWYFPNGPIEVPIGMGMVGRAWFPLDVEAFERAMMEGRGLDIEHATPPGLSEVTQQATAYLSAIQKRHKKVIVGGFSQGGTIASEAVLANAIPMIGVVLMSSTVVDRSRWDTIAGHFRNHKVFQSHGQFDPVLKFEMGKKLNQFLTQSGAEVEFHPFSGAHEIPLEILQKLTAFVSSLD